MELDTARRRFLQLSGTGAALSLAGCSSLQSTGASDSTGTPTGRQIVAVAIRANQQQLQKAKSNITSEYQDGNITRSEAQKKLQEVQTNLRSETITSFKDRVSSMSELAVEDSIEQIGAVLVSGSSEALIRSLSFEKVSALLPKEQFQTAKSQLQQSGNSTSTSSP